MNWKKVWGHLSTITRHRNEVIRHCKKAGIFWQGLGHDLSKYTPTEFLVGIRHYSDGKKSPNERERELYGHSPAWMHHKGRNRHHFEYWQDYNPKEGKTMPVKMPVRFFKELICDRIAASKIYQGATYTERHPLEYFKKSRAKEEMHPETAAMTEKMLRLLAEQGEAAMFRELKKLREY